VLDAQHLEPQFAAQCGSTNEMRLSCHARHRQDDNGLCFLCARSYGHQRAFSAESGNSHLEKEDVIMAIDVERGNKVS
jgi:hypothetical protein